MAGGFGAWGLVLLRFRAWGLLFEEFRVLGLVCGGFRVWGSVFGNWGKGTGFRGLNSTVIDLGVRV